MIVCDWDVWHVYSSFLDTERIDLGNAGSTLVQLGIATCALHRDGPTWWQVGANTRSGFTKIELNSNGSAAKIELEVDGGGESDLDGYPAEAWYQASQFRFYEIHAFGDDLRVPPPYIRVMLGEFHLISSEKNLKILIYPVIKIFESGVILISFRVIAPDEKLSTEDFINRFVNLSQWQFDEVLVPPSISEFASKAYVHSAGTYPFYVRHLLAQMERSHGKTVKELTSDIQSGDFIVKLAPLSGADGHKDSLSSLALTLFSIIGFILSNPRHGFPFILRGQRRLKMPGNWWNGRPHIHLIDFEGQCPSSKANIKMFGADFGKMLGRFTVGDKKIGLKCLSEDLRLFDDYSAFMAQSGSLWVWSSEGKNLQSAWVDPNRGHLIYEHHATVELIEYNYILHRALLAKINTAQKAEDIHGIRWSINQLRFDMADSSHSGEIRDLLNAGWKAMGIEDLQDRIKEALSIRATETSLKETRDNERFRRWLTILFGIIATPNLASSVIKPLWEISGVWQPKDPKIANIFWLAIAITIIIGVIVIFSHRVKMPKGPKD